MLAVCQVVTWQSNRPEERIGKAYGNSYLLNTNRMVDIITYDVTGSQFKYCQAPDDHRCSPDTIETNSAVVNLSVVQNTVPTSKFATLPIFPTLDITMIAVDTPVDTLIEWDDIALAWQTNRDFVDGVSHLTYYQDSFKRKTVIVDLSLAEINTLQTA